MSTKHTPGPWEITDDDETFVHCATEHYHQISAGKGYYAGEPNTGFGLQGFLSLSDARLIAAAPELLEALEELVKINEQHNQSFIDVIGNPLNWKDDYLDAARAAIKKATGEEA